MNLKHHWKCSMNYIFLDIDGVMNNRIDWMYKVNNGLNADRMFCSEAWDRLQQVVFETNAKIVLSSSWRLGFRTTIDGIEPKEILGYKDGYAVRLDKYFKEYSIPVVGCTTFHHDHRGNQIMQYVTEHFSSNDKWIVLDDEDTDMCNIPKEQIIKTEFETGLLPEHCERIVKYFKGE